MSEETIFARLSEIMRSVFDEETLVATPKMTADDVDGWDSLAHMRLIAAVERSFAIRFAAAQVSGLKNVGELAQLIQAKLPKN